MFDLEQSIKGWRNQMLAAGINNPETLNELETHLRDDISGLIVATKSEDAAFKLATERLGPPAPLKTEFNKLGARNWNLPLAWTAWIMFAISFFSPACGNYRGWECACISATCWTWPDSKDNWVWFHLSLLTFANLLMITSPLLLFRFSGSPRALIWQRCFNLAALLLVWSFIVRLLVNEDGQNLKVGAYIWAASFLLLFLSAFRRQARKAQYV